MYQIIELIKWFVKNHHNMPLKTLCSVASTFVILKEAVLIFAVAEEMILKVVEF